ncbi:peptide chain release factor 1 [Zavarzinella formosa]|uniref:peptide chain release factor 1 n=1 Tax=Zavarzinella formosa TaxID=360055 RepID=UPI0002EF07A7|nr:peptide chain release factor 1 [Zavarzinella formosa]
MWPSLDKKLVRYRELEALMVEPEVATNAARYATVAKEHASLAKLVKPYMEYEEVSKNLAQAEQMLAAETDPEMRAYAGEEVASLRAAQEKLKNKVEDKLLVDDGEDYGSLIVEVRAGTGGDEAALFAGDLFEMYTRYARTQGWQIEEIDVSPGEAGGFKEIVFGLRGDGVYQQLQYESGGHRVQRVPETETQGRIHTSAATVAILPEPDDVQVDLNPEDIEVETMRAGGAGGQHVNKTESAVRLWYKRGTPEEVEVKCQDERSQRKNRESAMRVLRSRVFENQRLKLHKERADARKSQIGTGDRSDRIRTYNFPQNRLTDHRIGLTLHKLDAIIMGDLTEVIQTLVAVDRKKRLDGLT